MENFINTLIAQAIVIEQHHEKPESYFETVYRENTAKRLVSEAENLTITQVLQCFATATQLATREQSDFVTMEVIKLQAEYIKQVY